MSYRNPKYINQSVQGSFDKLQNTINASVTQAKKVEKDQELYDKAKESARVLAGSTQSQATITRNASKNTQGNQMTRGKVGQYFEEYPARAAEIAMELSKTPKPDNYGELQSELEWINNSPETMKGMLTNAQSFLNIKDMSDIDPNQNSDILLASQVFNGELGFTEENGFTYDFKRGEGNTIEMVFTGQGYIPPMVNGKANTNPDDLVSFPPEGYSMNSAGMESMQAQNQSLIVSTPKMSQKVNSALQGTNILAGAKFNDDGVYQGGGIFNKDLLGDEIETKTYEGKDYEFLRVDPTKVAGAMEFELQEQVNSFIGPGGDNGQARSVWNMRIAKDASAVVFNKELAQQAFPGLGDDTEALKAAWKKGSGIWSYDKDIGDEQRKVFNVMYRKFIVDDVVATMEDDSLISQRSNATGQQSTTPNLNQPTS